jgi:molybdenum cofactor cytidylyltransferase
MTVEGIVLAAGCSNRTRPDCKLAFMLGGLTVLERSIRSMKPFCSRVFVVTGAYRDLIEDIVNRLEGVVPVYNPHFSAGMYESVKTGLRAAAADKVLILPGDCPFVGSKVYAALLAEKGDIILPEWRRQTGHPVLLTRAIVLELLCDDRYESLRQFIAAHPHKRVAVDDAGIFKDIDTLEEYRQVQWDPVQKDEGR